MDILTRFGTDSAREIEGVIHPMGPTAEVVVARWMNPNHAEANRKAHEAREVELELATNPVLRSDILKDITAKAMAGTVLTGFKGLTYGGEPIEYSVENAEKLLQIRDFQDLIYRLSVERAHYATRKLEADAKNS